MAYGMNPHRLLQYVEQLESLTFTANKKERSMNENQLIKIVMVGLLCLILTVGCKSADSADDSTTASDTGELGQSLETASTKDLKQLLVTDWNEMSEADQDKLRYLTGAMSSAEFNAKYQSITASGTGFSSQSLLDDISNLIWGSWDKVEIPGAVCSNGSQYKIFVQKSTGFINWLKGYTKNLIVYFEGGGACWDYPSCTRQTGIRGAANPDGIPDNHMSIGDYLDPNKEGGSVNAASTPLILRNHPTGDNVQTSNWNMVFIPYCTGDVHAGNKTVVYEDPTGVNPPITYHHKGAPNMEKVVDYLQDEFPNMKKLFVSGNSAGGAGSLVNYHFIRKALDPDKSYLLNDSGPVFDAPDSSYNHWPLQQQIKGSWNLDYILSKFSTDMPAFDFNGNFGVLMEALADEWPNDILGITLFTRDANYSMYSYARFFDLDENIPQEKEQVLQLWREDVEAMMLKLDTIPNFSYFVPYYRKIIDSHCTTTVQFKGTEILDTGIDVGDYIEDMLDDGSVTSYHEPDNPSDADVTDFWMELVELLM